MRQIDFKHSQTWRHLVQVIFLLLNLAIGLQFVLFVRYFESGGQAPRVLRPPGVEGWLPIAGLMNLKYFLATGDIPAIHPAAMFLLAAFMLIALLLRKSFCSWLCPVGTLSEMLWKLGRRFIGRNWRLPRGVDIPLRSLKYILLAFFIYAIGGMSAAAIEAFMRSPYGLVVDIKMLDFFRNPSTAAAVTLTILLVLSVFIQNFWCRYLCPYGALVGIASLFSPATICRDESACIHCGRCAKACPSLLRVDALVRVQSPECTGCMECVDVCPVQGALQMSFWSKERVPGWAMAVCISLIFLGIVGFAKWNNTWAGSVPDAVYQYLIPRIDGLSHP